MFWSPEKFLSDPQSLNSYSYARNNPIVLLDSSGESWKTFGQGLASPFVYAYNNPGETFLIVGGTIALATIAPVAVAVAGVALGGYAIGSSLANAYYAPDTDTRDYYLGEGTIATAFTVVGIKAGGSTVKNVKEPIIPRGKTVGPTVDSRTGSEVGRFIVDPKGNTMIEPVGGKTIPSPKNPIDTHTTYPNGANYQRLNPNGHLNDPIPHGHGHLPGTGPNMRGQGPSIDIFGNVVSWMDKAAHWPINK
jgi:hypothetical protein